MNSQQSTQLSASTRAIKTRQKQKHNLITTSQASTQNTYWKKEADEGMH